ncbi:MAG: DUF4831 family protein [Bacteroidetes bacterium]|nr:DUF4831 family protein [Bacteroidota bacterium]
MKMKFSTINKLSVIAVIAIIFLSSCSKFNVIKVKHYEKPVNEAGIYYALPQTVVSIEVKVKKNDLVKGPYAAFASKYLGLNNVAIANSTTYELAEIKVTNFAEPDSSQFYLVKLGKGHCKNSTFLALNEAGLILSANEFPESNENSADIKPNSESFNSSFGNFSYFADANTFEKIDTIIENVNLDTVSIAKQVLVKSLVEKSMEQKAKDAVDFIMRVKENKFNLLSGTSEVNYEKSTLTYMIQELEKLESDYMKLFTGLTSTKTIKYRFNYIPQLSNGSNLIPLFKFSEKDGIMDTSSSDGDLITISFERNFATGQLANFENRKENSNKHGFYYRIPENAIVKIKESNILKAEASFPISQFGVVTSLPTQKSKVQFYPNSGALKTVGINREGHFKGHGRRRH